MQNQLFINGERVHDVSSSRSLFYGEGLFETFRYKANLPVLFDKHIERMKEGADLLKIPFPGKGPLIELIHKAIGESGIHDAYVKISLLSEGDLPFYGQSKQSQVLVIIRKYDKPRQSIKLKVNSFRRSSGSPLIGIKSTNYLDNILARREAVSSGFDEAIFLNEEDQITECAASNLFWYKNETLFTPSEACGLLIGTTRNLVLRCLSRSNINISEGKFLFSDLRKADFVFVTNSLIGCVPIAQIEGHSFNIDHPIFNGIKNTLLRELKWLK